MSKSVLVSTAVLVLVPCCWVSSYSSDPCEKRNELADGRGDKQSGHPGLVWCKHLSGDHSCGSLDEVYAAAIAETWYHPLACLAPLAHFLQCPQQRRDQALVAIRGSSIRIGPTTHLRGGRRAYPTNDFDHHHHGGPDDVVEPYVDTGWGGIKPSQKYWFVAYYAPLAVSRSSTSAAVAGQACAHW